VTALCVVALLLPVAEAGAEPSPERLEEVRREAERTREKLEAVEGRQRATSADLEKVEARRAELDAELSKLGGDLASAEGRLEAAERQVAETAASLERTEDELDRTRVALEEQRELFGDRARAAYIYGGMGFANVMLDIEDMAQFARSVKYVQEVVSADRRQVEVITGLERRVEVKVAELEDLKAEHTAQRQVAAAERDEVAALVARRREVRRQVAAEAERHRTLLAQLKSDAASYTEHIASLEQESADIEVELRRRAEEEARRKAAEERRRREEEARRIAAAERAQQQQRAAAARAAEEQRRTAERRSARSEAAPSQRSQPAQAEPAPSRSGRMQRPSNGRLTSGYGWRTHPISGARSFHAGVDFGAPTGSPIYAAESGTVYSAGWRGGYGNTIVIEHGGGLTTLYAHQSRFAVSAGQQVSRGQVIGYVGSTGQSTGPHLHFEVRVNGATRDPMGYL
jgi:murein DD-endopeptidase MepM/ murein hydrolase activator NlpD